MTKVRLGDVFEVADYCRDEHGKIKNKFCVVLGLDNYFMVIRVLTSKPRVEDPLCSCSRKDIYPVYYCGVLKFDLERQHPTKKWLDLRSPRTGNCKILDECDKIASYNKVFHFDEKSLVPMLRCFKSSEDITGYEERLVDRALTSLGL